MLSVDAKSHVVVALDMLMLFVKIGLMLLKSNLLHVVFTTRPVIVILTLPFRRRNATYTGSEATFGHNLGTSCVLFVLTRRLMKWSHQHSPAKPRSVVSAHLVQVQKVFDVLTLWFHLASAVKLLQKQNHCVLNHPDCTANPSEFHLYQ